MKKSANAERAEDKSPAHSACSRIRPAVEVLQVTVRHRFRMQHVGRMSRRDAMHVP